MAGLRRYVLGTAVLMALALAPLVWLMPELVRLFLGVEYEDAIPAARIILFAGAIQLVFGWTKSLPVSIGRPDLRIWAHGVETVVLVPALLVLGSRSGATGAAAAVLISTVAFALVWTAIVLRMRRTPFAPIPPTAAAAGEARAA